MNPAKIAKIRTDQIDKALASSRHQELIAHDDNIAQTIYAATIALIKYMEGHTVKAEVVNPVESVSTPDVKFVVEALQVIDTTLQKHENTDLSGVTELLQRLVNEASLIPKELPEGINYTKQISDLTKGLKSLEATVKAQKLVAEAPIVNVPETKIDVAPPDLKPIQKASESLEKTIKTGQDDMKQASEKVAAGLITEKFDEYRIVYAAKFDDDEEDVVSGMKYYLSGKLVATTKYSYDKEGRLTGVKKT